MTAAEKLRELAQKLERWEALLVTWGHESGEVKPDDCGPCDVHFEIREALTDLAKIEGLQP